MTALKILKNVLQGILIFASSLLLTGVLLVPFTFGGSSYLIFAALFLSPLLVPWAALAMLTDKA